MLLFKHNPFCEWAFSASPQTTPQSAPALLFSYRHCTWWWWAATSEVLCRVISPTGSLKDLKSQHKEEEVRMKCNSFIGNVSPCWIILAMLHSFPEQLTDMIWSVTAFLSQKLICTQSCLFSGAWEFLAAVLWHVILPQRKTLLWIRRNSNPQTCRNSGVWYFYLLYSTVLRRLALRGGEEPKPA